MTQEIKAPDEYMPRLMKIRESNPYARRGVLRIERKTNRHPETSGGSWGWYEVCPLGITIGYWGSMRDDLRGIDIDAWNTEAARLSCPPNERRE